MLGKIIMVASGKGGTGKSTISVLMSAEIAAQNKRVLLIELDSGLRSIDIISGVYGKTVYDIEDIFKGRCDADKAIVESPLYKGLSVVSAPYSGGSVDEAALLILTQKLSGLFDFIVIDTAAGMGAPFCAAASVADTAVLVLTADPIAMRDGKIVADELYDKLNVRLIINKLDEKAFRKTGIKDLDEFIDTVGVQLLGLVPQTQNIAQASATGAILPENTQERKAFQNIAARILGEHRPLAVN